ncbi:MAG: HD domain-containing protein [archaeon]
MRLIAENSMEINDRVYGKIVIDESVILELISSKPLQRLKKIGQAGASKYYSEKKNITRFEHSIGVLFLLKKLGASVEEQIAGLLHDVPHTAFSHVIDFVFKSEAHEFHEKFHEKLIMQSEIPDILKKYGFEVEKIIDEKNFPLLERNSPELCADRIDYTFRDFVANFGFDEKINTFMKHFVVKNLSSEQGGDGRPEIIFDDAETATQFAEFYLDMDKKIWAHPIEVALYEILALALKRALKLKIINEEDLFENDEFVFNKLKDSGDEEILKNLEKLNPKLTIVDDPDNCHFYSKTKFRFVNPKFIDIKVDGTEIVMRVTDKFPEFQQQLDTHKEEVERGCFVKVVSW